MSNTPHELAQEFPEHAAKMHALKTSDSHFARLFDEYHEVNRAIHRAETDVEPLAMPTWKRCASSVWSSRTGSTGC